MRPAWISRMKDRQERVRRANEMARLPEYWRVAERERIAAWKVYRNLSDTMGFFLNETRHS